MMLQKHRQDAQLNYLRRALIHDSAVNGIGLSFFTGE